MATIDELKEQLDRIEKVTAISAKSVLNLDEVIYLTGFKKGTIYELTSKNAIPHSKRGGRLFFLKAEIEDWLMTRRMTSQAEMESKASTYIAMKRI